MEGGEGRERKGKGGREGERGREAGRERERERALASAAGRAHTPRKFQKPFKAGPNQIPFCNASDQSVVPKTPTMLEAV